MSCRNERIRTGALEWSWAGPLDEHCKGEAWQLYRPAMAAELAAAAGPAELPLLSCADLEPVGPVPPWALLAMYCTPSMLADVSI